MRHDGKNIGGAGIAVHDPARRGAKRVAGEDVRLPMRLNLHSGDAVIDRKQLQSVHERMIVPILENEGGHDGADLRYLAARKALVAVPLEPEIGIAVAGTGSHSRKSVLQRICDQTRGGGRVDRLPQRTAEACLAAFPEGAPDLAGDEPILEDLLVLAFPDTAVVVSQLVIDSEESAIRQTSRRVQRECCHQCKESDTDAARKWPSYLHGLCG